MQNKLTAFKAKVAQTNINDIKGVKYVDSEGMSHVFFAKKAQDLFQSVLDGKAAEGSYTVIEKRDVAFEFTNYKDEGIEVMALCRVIDTYNPESRIPNFCYAGSYLYDNKWYPITKEELFKIGESVVYAEDHEQFNDPCLVVDTSLKEGRFKSVAVGYAEIKDVTAITYFKPR